MFHHTPMNSCNHKILMTLPTSTKTKPELIYTVLWKKHNISATVSPSLLSEVISRWKRGCFFANQHCGFSPEVCWTSQRHFLPTLDSNFLSSDTASYVEIFQICGPRMRTDMLPLAAWSDHSWYWFDLVSGAYPISAHSVLQLFWYLMEFLKHVRPNRKFARIGTDGDQIYSYPIWTKIGRCPPLFTVGSGSMSTPAFRAPAPSNLYNYWRKYPYWRRAPSGWWQNVSKTY